MEALLMFILNVYIATVGVSAIVKISKDVKAKQIIEEKGFKVTQGEKEPQEFVADFFKENLYIIKPLKNIKKTWKLFWGNNKKYAAEKMSKYQKEGRLEEINPPKREEIKPIKQEEKKTEEKKPEVKVTQSIEKNNELVIDEFKTEIENSNDIQFVLEVQKTYRQKSKEERARYNILVSEFKNTTDKTKKAEIKEEITKLCRRVKAYDELYLCAKIRKEELQNTMNISIRK